MGGLNSNDMKYFFDDEDRVKLWFDGWECHIVNGFLKLHVHWTKDDKVYSEDSDDYPI